MSIKNTILLTKLKHKTPLKQPIKILYVLRFKSQYNTNTQLLSIINMKQNNIYQSSKIRNRVYSPT